MSIIQDAQDTGNRFKEYIAQFKSLFRSRGITTWNFPWRVAVLLNEDKEFRASWNNLWKSVASADGGKITLATACTIVGLALGGVGVAALGGAIGIPLAAVLAPLGLLIGNELDSSGKTRDLFSWCWWKHDRPDPRETDRTPKVQEEILVLRALVEQAGAEIGEIRERCRNAEENFESVAQKLDRLRSGVERHKETSFTEIGNLSSEIQQQSAVLHCLSTQLQQLSAGIAVTRTTSRRSTWLAAAALIASVIALAFALFSRL